MTIAVDLGRKATKQTNKQIIMVFALCQSTCLRISNISIMENVNSTNFSWDLKA